MTKTILLMIFLLIVSGVFFTQDIVEKKDNVTIKKTFNIQANYLSAEEQLLISPTDNNCTFYISDGPPPSEILIIGSEHARDDQSQYGDYDSMYIDCGSKDGLKEGDMLLIVGKGNRIRSPISRRKLGHYYQKKSLAKIICIYEDRSVIALESTCHPVEIGDYAVPYHPEDTLWEKKPNYTLCLLPDDHLKADVIYLDFDSESTRDQAGTSDYVGIEIGEGLVKKEDFILFYRKLRPDLPYMIIGSGVIIHTEREVSTVKVIDCYSDLVIGDKAAVLSIDYSLKKGVPEPEAEEKKEKGDEQATQKGEEDLPLFTPEDQRLIVDLYFGFDQKTPGDEYNAEMEKIAAFIAQKTEYVIVLRGYCCSIGGEEYNLKLSQERVEAVKSLLVEQYKIDPARIETYYYGEKENPYDNSLESERQKNRLVKIEVIGK